MLFSTQKYVLSSLLVSTLLFSGCASNGGPEVSADSVGQMKTTEIGTIQSTKDVVVKDDGTGTVVGAVAGVALGSLFGSGGGQIAMAAAGGVAGGVIGNQVGKSNAQDITILFNNGSTAAVVVKHNHYLVGDKIQITKEGNKIISTQRLAQ